MAPGPDASVACRGSTRHRVDRGGSHRSGLRAGHRVSLPGRARHRLGARRERRRRRRARPRWRNMESARRARGARARARLPGGLQAPLGVPRLPRGGRGQGRRLQRGQRRLRGPRSPRPGRGRAGPVLLHGPGGAHHAVLPPPRTGDHRVRGHRGPDRPAGAGEEAGPHALPTDLRRDDPVDRERTWRGTTTAPWCSARISPRWWCSAWNPEGLHLRAPRTPARHASRTGVRATDGFRRSRGDPTIAAAARCADTASAPSSPPETSPWPRRRTPPAR